HLASSTSLSTTQTTTPSIYTLSLHDALPISRGALRAAVAVRGRPSLPPRRRQAPGNVPDLARFPRRPLRLAPAAWCARCPARLRSEEHTSELQSRGHLVCRLLLEKKNHM